VTPKQRLTRFVLTTPRWPMSRCTTCCLKQCQPISWDQGHSGSRIGPGTTCLGNRYATVVHVQGGSCGHLQACLPCYLIPHITHTLQGGVSGEGTHGRIVQSLKVCASHVRLLDYPLLPVPDIHRLPPFRLWKPASPSPASAAPTAPLPCMSSDTPWFTISQSPNLTESARCVKSGWVARGLSSNHSL
jgi:hypothetical protein